MRPAFMPGLLLAGTALGALVAQRLYAGADHRKIVGGARSDHVFLRFLVITRSRRLAIGLGPLFLSLLTRGFTGRISLLETSRALTALERRRLYQPFA
jgi:hypothetical protein